MKRFPFTYGMIKIFPGVSVLICLAMAFLVIMSPTSPKWYFPTATPIGVQLEIIPVRFQGDWLLDVPFPDESRAEWYEKNSDWYASLVLHIGRSVTDCKLLELQESGKLRELETAVEVKSITLIPYVSEE